MKSKIISIRKKLQQFQKLQAEQSASTQGFTLFVAMVVATILLSIGFSIGNIILKQLVLTGSGKESQIAFYAADSGAECALYWDEKDVGGNTMIDSYFGTSTPVGETSPEDYIARSVICGSGPTILPVSKYVSADMKVATTTFFVNYSQTINGKDFYSCAKVTVVKDYPFTRIESRGYDSNYDPATGCVTDNPRTVERGVVVNY